MGLGTWGIILATAVYVPSIFMLGESPFDVDFAQDQVDCGVFDFICDFVGGAVDLTGNLFQFVTLSNVEPAELRSALLIPLGLAFLLIIAGLIRGGGTPG